MSVQRKPSKRARNLFIYGYLILILLTLLTTASYTWFSLSQTPRVSDMYMFINSENGLELSADPKAEDWQLQLDFRDLVSQTAPLRPVTWSERDQRFYAAVYGMDGRQMDIWNPLSDEFNANKDNYNGYYIKASFYARSAQPVKVFLSKAVEVDEGLAGSGTYVIGAPVWNAGRIRHDNGGMGAEYAIRIGIRVTRLDEQMDPIEDSAEFYIYEPNSDRHTDGSEGYVPTPSIHGGESLIPDVFIIRQTTSTWKESYPVERDVVVRDLGEFVSSAELFTLYSEEVVKIDLYVWLEGQDVDCVSLAQQAKIMASIQFSTAPDDQSGMKPIE